MYIGSYYIIELYNINENIIFYLHIVVSSSFQSICIHKGKKYENPLYYRKLILVGELFK